MHHWNPCGWECACCGENIGIEDSETIRLQLQNREKNCFWCGEDFDLNEDEIEDRVADPIHCENERFFDMDDLVADVETECNMSYETRRNVIKDYYGVDIEKEEFIPPFVDKKTRTIYDRAYDAVPYFKIVRNLVAHKTLLIVNNYPGISMSALEKNRGVKDSFRFNPYTSRRYMTIPEKPIHRLLKSDLIDMESTHYGWIKQPTKLSGKLYEHGVPKYKRTYTINSNGIGILDIFDDLDKKVVML